ncbi:hypothetical protein BWK63_06845 [Flavobacterium covae]|uniref:SMODS-associating 2TM beta-strand rich effector domain-containing protein n=1 Tax=Flavobacterium covae TaxID=2906076 RepID=A0ABW8PIC9_9FLAO|nr:MULTISPECIES: hypothetical protein [Flavobacterium]OWP81240.1 hypothetical protein BWK63_06845 [Flavobacterium covae]POR18967.1 hypothetical protein BWK57_13730 [Flavobacterium columnare]
MIKFDLLLLPLVGGYVFLITFYLTKFYHQRIDRQRLIFNSVIAGVLISVFGLYLNELLKLDCFVCFRKFFKFLIPLKHKGLTVSFYIFLISYPIAKIANRIFPDNFALYWIIQKWGDDYEKLFWDSVGDENNLLMITTKSNKVYVGYLSNVSEPLKNSHITIIPSMSGYRDKETQVFKITTDYIDTLENYFKENKTNKIEDVIGMTIPTSEIIIVSKFIPELFKGFKEKEEVENNKPQVELEKPKKRKNTAEK